MKARISSVIASVLAAALAGCAFFADDPCAEGSVRGVSADEYLDIVEAAVASYSDDHLRRYIADVERDGVQEHGFARLAANLAVLVANGRMTERRAFLERMMTLCCEWAPKGKMKLEGNEFSVRELAFAVAELERAEVFDEALTDSWRAGITAVDAGKCYSIQLPVGHRTANNWLVFGCASEQARIALGMGGDAERVEKYVADQLRWFDSNGMYKDPFQPMVYDFVTRLQFMAILHFGYDGPSKAKLEELLERSSGPTLEMLSAGGEIPFGGRSNQFLHNHTFYAAVCEWYAAWYGRRGDAAKAAKFRLAARRSVDVLGKWLEIRPLRHVKNRYPREEGIRSAGIGCEPYAYFDKYMITMGSWATMAYLFLDDSLPAAEEDTSPASFTTTPDFHMIFLRAGEYSAQFDYAAYLPYDSDGLGRFQRKGAPETICISTPCTPKPSYRTELPNSGTLAFVPVGEGAMKPIGCGHDSSGAWADWIIGRRFTWRCRLTGDGLDTSLIGSGTAAVQLPAFAFDGESETETVVRGKTLSILYRGWKCEYVTDGEIVDTGVYSCNRNGRYRVFEARAKNRLKVKVRIVRDESPAGEKR